MGRRHAENLRRSVPHARLVAVADIDLERARTVAAELEIDTAYPSVEALAAHSGLDAVVIASPPKYHLPAIVAAAAGGKHVFCEKPLALSLDDADAALDAVRKAGVILQVGHMRRYDPPYMAARSRIEAGEIGQVVVFKSIGRDQETSPAGACQVEANGTMSSTIPPRTISISRAGSPAMRLSRSTLSAPPLPSRNSERWMLSTQAWSICNSPPAPLAISNLSWMRSTVTIFALRSLVPKARSSWGNCGRLHSS
jgi:hypothetical protein